MHEQGQARQKLAPISCCYGNVTSCKNLIKGNLHSFYKCHLECSNCFVRRSVTNKNALPSEISFLSYSKRSASTLPGGAILNVAHCKLGNDDVSWSLPGSRELWVRICFVVESKREKNSTSAGITGHRLQGRKAIVSAQICKQRTAFFFIFFA